MKGKHRPCLFVALLLLFLFSGTLHTLSAQTLKTCLIEGDLNTAKDRIQTYGSGRLNFKYSDHANWTALMVAVKLGYADIVKMMVDKNAKVNIQAEGGLDALMVACANNEYEIAEYLLKNDADMKNSLKFKRDGFTYEKLKMLDTKYFGNSSTGWNAMFYACQGGDTLLMELLHDHGASYTQINNSGESLLFAAVFSEDVHNVSKLIGAGADVNQVSENGHTAFMNATKHGNLEIMQLLVDHGADIEAVNRERHNALYYATLKNNREVIRFLFKQGMEPKIFRPNIDDYLATAIVYETYAELHAARQEDSTQCKDSYMIAAQCYNEIGHLYKRQAEDGISASIGSAFLFGGFIDAIATSITSSSDKNLNTAYAKEAFYSRKAKELEALAHECGD